MRVQILDTQWKMHMICCDKVLLPFLRLMKDEQWKKNRPTHRKTCWQSLVGCEKFTNLELLSQWRGERRKRFKYFGCCTEEWFYPRIRKMVQSWRIVVRSFRSLWQKIIHLFTSLCSFSSALRSIFSYYRKRRELVLYSFLSFPHFFGHLIGYPFIFYEQFFLLRLHTSR